jgi:hypothetical protein
MVEVDQQRRLAHQKKIEALAWTAPAWTKEHYDYVEFVDLQKFEFRKFFEDFSCENRALYKFKWT